LVTMEVIMTKIMLVEDDKSLREIYGVRLLAEGYEIISAGDGEEALAMAVKEKPDLILSDVMMPKISGFDMLDILRSTPETKDIKVIMMTALSSEDQRSRGETLGANRYLVKSQVGIEDVVRTVHDVLSDVPVAAAQAAQKFGNPVPTEVVEQPEPTTDVAPAQPAPVSSAAIPPTPQPEPNVEPAPVANDIPPVPEPLTTAPAPTLEPTPVTEPQATPPTVTIAPTVPTTPPTEPEPPLPEPPKPAEPVSTAPAAPVNPVATQPTEPAQTSPATTPTPAPAPAINEPSAHLPEPTAPFSTAAPASLGERVIYPPTPQEKPQQDISAMISQELELNDGSNTQPQPPAAQ
jgi:CheY-like chemotaxis protein